jgi:predicted SnoaL-like aldol condensation-catalyzing enzyme
LGCHPADADPIRQRAPYDLIIARAARYAAAIAKEIRMTSTADNDRGFFGEVVQALFIDQDLDRFAEFVSDESYVQHNPAIQDGKDAALAFLRPILETKGPPAKVRHVLVDGDIGVIHAQVLALDGISQMNIIDMFRISNGRLVEHWDVMATIPAAIDARC